MNWTWIFAGFCALGAVLAATGGKKQLGDKEQPATVQVGYLLLVLGGFGLFAQFMSFTAVMLVFVGVTGAVLLVDTLLLRKRRAADVVEPHVVEYSRSFFPVIFVIFILRAFLVEPFQIPSSSMRPGLVVGDFILVNKFTYGIRMPVLNTVLVPMNQVERGDVAVFNFPPNPQVNFIKRVIGLPGDTVEYRNKEFRVNGQLLTSVSAGTYEYMEQGLAMVHARQFTETIVTQSGEKKTYEVLKVDGVPPVFMPQVADFSGRDQCSYDASGFTCRVPQGHYFMIGDNRDNSHDGRYWGFVPDSMLVGKAFFIWMNLSQPSRIGSSIR